MLFRSVSQSRYGWNTQDAGHVVGKDGQQGLQGLQGLQGVQGAKGDKGDVGQQGIQGVKGDAGVAGANAQNPNFSVSAMSASTPSASVSGTYPNLNILFGIPSGGCFRFGNVLPLSRCLWRSSQQHHLRPSREKPILYQR